MGSFVFQWDHPANEVYVTGTFDDWSKSEKLIKTGDVFEKNVTLPSADEKIYYKFVVDGNWVTDHTAPQENDYSGNLNNVLTVDRIVKHKPETESHTPATAGIMSGVTPSSTTANLAKETFAKESLQDKSYGGSSDLPGSFPETPGLMEKNEYGVNPLPAFDGAVNPISLAPGEKVPHPSTLTNHSVTSNVRDDPELVAAAKKEGEQIFSVNPLPAFAGGVNPISLPAGSNMPNVSHITDKSINSGVTLDKESYENSGGLGKAPVLPDVVTPQSEREHLGTGILGLPAVSKNMIPESSLPMGSSGEGMYDASPLMQSSGPQSTTAMLAAAVPLESSKSKSLESSNVPAIVKESQKEAGYGAEASAIPAEVNEKSAVEKELLEEVPLAPTTAEGTAGEGTDKTEAGVTAGEVAAAVGGAALAVGGAAYAYASKGASAVASQLPSAETVQKSVSDSSTAVYNQLPSAETVQKSVSDSATAVSNQLPSAATVQKSASDATTAVSNQLPSAETVQKSVSDSTTAVSNQLPTTAGVQKSVSNGASAVTSKLPTSIQDSIASMNQEAVSHSTAKDTPTIVKESIAESGQSPEAAANEEAVLEKKAVEKELLSEIKRETSVGESAPKITSEFADQEAVSNSIAKDTPAVVNESITQSGQSPEAAANEEAVLEKKALEKELLSQTKRETSAGEPAPKITSSETSSSVLSPASEKKIMNAEPVSPYVAPVTEMAPLTEKKIANAEPESPFVAPITEKNISAPETSSPLASAPLTSSPPTSASVTSSPLTSAPLASVPVVAPVAPITEKKVEAPATLAAPVVQRPVESRDVSPGTVPGSHTQAPAAAAVAPTTPAKKITPSSSKADESPSASTTDKKKNRRSIFGKIKDKFSSKH